MNTENVDSRMKLESDIRFGSTMTMYSNSDETEITAKWSDVMGWLDRQAAITEREVKQANMDNWRVWCESLGIPCTQERAGLQIQEYEHTIAELRRKIDELEQESIVAGGTATDWYQVVKKDNAELTELSNDNDLLQKQMLGLEDTIISLEAERDELQAKLDAYNETHMELPVDADGVPIRVGDEMESGNERFVVCAVAPGRVHRWNIHNIGELDRGTVAYPPNSLHHVKPRTIEDVLREYRSKADDIYNDQLIGGEDRADALESLDEEYAAEIREANWE